MHKNESFLEKLEILKFKSVFKEEFLPFNLKNRRSNAKYQQQQKKQKD